MFLARIFTSSFSTATRFCPSAVWTVSAHLKTNSVNQQMFQRFQNMKEPTCKQTSVVKHGQPVHWQNSEDLPSVGGITRPFLVPSLMPLLVPLLMPKLVPSPVVPGWSFFGVEWSSGGGGVGEDFSSILEGWKAQLAPRLQGCCWATGESLGGSAVPLGCSFGGRSALSDD